VRGSPRAGARRAPVREGSPKPREEHRRTCAMPLCSWFSVSLAATGSTGPLNARRPPNAAAASACDEYRNFFRHPGHVAPRSRGELHLIESVDGDRLATGNDRPRTTAASGARQGLSTASIRGMRSTSECCATGKRPCENFSMLSASAACSRSSTGSVRASGRHACKLVSVTPSGVPAGRGAEGRR
jgi:hypothetical protein